MVARIVNFYKVFVRTILNGYQYGIRRTHPDFSPKASPPIHAQKASEIIPENKPIVTCQDSHEITPSNGMHWEGEWSGSIGSWIEQRSIASTPYNAQSSQDMMRVSMALKQPGVPTIWQHMINTSGSMAEWKVLNHEIFPVLTPETAKIITQHSSEAECIYICKSTEETPNGRQLYKIGRSTNVADRMRRHKRCKLEFMEKFEVFDPRLTEKLIHCKLKEIPHVSHGVVKCPFCGTGHREIFSVVKGKEGAELVKSVVNECMLLDKLCFGSRLGRFN